MTNSCINDVYLYLELGQSFIAANVALSALAVVVCLTAIVCLIRLELLRKVVYRMALYQVLCALAYSVSFVSQMTVFAIRQQAMAGALCRVLGFVVLYLEWTKLMLTIWSLFHLFCFSVRYRDMKACEMIYMGTSIAVPLVVAAVPFATGSYGQSGAWCWIINTREEVAGSNSSNNNCTSAAVDSTGVIEQFVLWYGPAFVVLFFESIAVSVILLKLASSSRLCLTNKKESALLFAEKQYKKALAQMLPLMAYPVLFCTLIVPPLIYRLYGALGVVPSIGLLAVVLLCFSGWSLASSIALVVHIAVVVRYRHKKRISLSSYPLHIPN